MDKNDPFNRPSGDTGGNHDEEHEFIDDARYDDPNAPEVREAEYAAGQEEWDQPIDEFAEEEQHVAAEQQQEKHDPFAEEGPVEDEFSDHPQHAEDDHDLEDNAEEASPQPRSKASSMAGMKPPSNLMKYIPYVGGGLAAVVIAFFGLQQFMGDSSPAPTQPSLENQNTWDSASANPTQNSNTQQAANEFQPLATPTQVEQPAQQPSATSTNMITPAATDTANTQAALPQATPTQPQAANPLETRITELTQQLETMKQTQDQLNQKLQAATATPPSMDESSKAAQQALVDRIAQLEQKLSNAQSSSSSQASSSVDVPTGKASRRSKRASQPAADDSSGSEPTAQQSKRASTDFMVAKKPKRAKRRASVDANSTSGTEGYAPVNSAPFQGWILRSAQPGSAWLSQGAYSSDLRRVVPGDKVQGLGTVTAIRQIAGRWIVEGTQGAVR